MRRRRKADESGHHPLPAQSSIENITESLRTLDGDLEDDERTAHPGRAGTARNGTSIPKSGARIRSKSLKDWDEPEKQPASDTGDEREAEDARVHREIDSFRNHEGMEQRRVTGVTSSAPIEPKIPRSTDSVSH